jgi:hypothetical protein
MKRFSFEKSSISTGFRPLNTKATKQTKVAKRKKTAPTEKLKIKNLKYVEKRSKGWKYIEVVNIPKKTRKKIFYDLVIYQDKTGDGYGAYDVISKRHGLPERAVRAIAIEGALKGWPMPKL